MDRKQKIKEFLSVIEKEIEDIESVIESLEIGQKRNIQAQEEKLEELKLKKEAFKKLK